MLHTAEFKKEFLLLCAMQFSVKSKPKIFLLTRRYMVYIAPSLQYFPLCNIGRSSDYAAQHGVTYICEFLCEFATICINYLTP
jgi:hypothetical protein